MQSLRETFTVVELLWMCMGGIGAVIALAALHDARLDRQAVLRLLDDPRKPLLAYMASEAVRQEALRLLEMLIVFAVGLVAGLTSPPIPPELAKQIPTWTPVGIALTAALFSIILIIILQLLLDRRLRKRFYGRQRLQADPSLTVTEDPVRRR